jgi:opacity protein-like surface antigen
MPVVCLRLKEIDVRALITLAAVVLVGTATVRADGFITPFLGYNFGGDSNCATFRNCEDKRTNFGVSFGTMGPVFGFEGDLGFARDFFGKVPGVDNSVFSLTGDLLMGVGRGPVQPYFLLGMGLIRPRTSVSLTPVFQEFDKNSLGWAIGGGVAIYPTRRVGVRGDMRHLRTLQDVPIVGSSLQNAKLDFWRASAGLALRF